MLMFFSVVSSMYSSFVYMLLFFLRWDVSFFILDRYFLNMFFVVFIFVIVVNFSISGK